MLLISTDFHCNEKCSLHVTCEDMIWNGSVRQIGCSKPALALPNVWAPASALHCHHADLTKISMYIFK